jgi:hypothetical protein
MENAHMTTTETASRICARCRTNPTLLPAMSICRECLQRQVEAERRQRERRMRELTKLQRLERRTDR